MSAFYPSIPSPMQSSMYGSALPLMSEPYPTKLLPGLVQDFIHCVVASTQASEALVAPVVLAAMAAAVQGVADVKAPYSQVLPTSLFFFVIANSGERKSSVLKHATLAFEEFERKCFSLLSPEQKYTDIGAHPFFLEEATEMGIIDIYRQGAKSLFYALDEGVTLMGGKLDIPALCKRFDGATLRRVNKKEGTIYIPDTRASLCLMIQDAPFQKLMNRKGDIFIGSGLLPRMLMSMTSIPNLVKFTGGMPSTDPANHHFHDRVRELLDQYSEILRGEPDGRSTLALSAEAEKVWCDFTQHEISRLLLQYSSSEKVIAFLRRAGEQVLRLSAVLQWFCAPKPFVEKWAVDTAVGIVNWHMREAQMVFGEQPEAIKNQQSAHILYDYLNRKIGMQGGSVSRSNLIRCAPQSLRRAQDLDMAIDCIMQEGRVYVQKIERKEYIFLNGNFENNNEFLRIMMGQQREIY